MDITLYSTGLEDLSPPWYRSPGIHGSQLIDRLCLRYGHYQRDRDGSPISDRNREMGHSFEDMIARRIETKHPGEYLHNPEIECDGIYLTPDLVWKKQRADHEVKWTWMSPANSPEDLKMWKYLAQGQAYLYALRRVAQGTARIRERVLDPRDIEWITFDEVALGLDDYTTLYLTVGFANDFRPPKEQIPTWRIKFFPEELAMNWAMLMDEKRRLEEEQREETIEKEMDADTWLARMLAQGETA